MAIIINNRISLSRGEVELSAIRSQGAGGQNVNKVATAVHLRFDIAASSLPEEYKQKLLAKNDRRISSAGVIVIKVQQFRSHAKNRELAAVRLVEIIRSVEGSPQERLVTKRSKRAHEKRLQKKNLRSRVKIMRRKVEE